TTTIAAGKSAGRSAKTRLRAFSPPAEAAMATTSKPTWPRSGSVILLRVSSPVRAPGRAHRGGGRRQVDGPDGRGIDQDLPDQGGPLPRVVRLRLEAADRRGAALRLKAPGQPLRQGRALFQGAQRGPERRLHRP